MAASIEVGNSLEGLEELFLQDITDDFFYLNEEKNSSDVPDTYWLNIVELKMECSEVHTKMTKVQYSSVWLGQTWLESSLSYGTQVMVVS